MAATTMDFVAMPKLELHAHLSGSITPQCLHEIWSAKIAAGDENAKALDDPLTVMSGDGGFDLTTFFPLFSRYIYTLINTASALCQATRDVLRNFEKDGVVYLELRTTPRDIPGTNIDKHTYIQLVLACINEFNQESKTMVAKLILSIDRRNSLKEANEVVDFALRHSDRVNFKMERNTLKYEMGVVGVDLCGNPAAHDVSIFRSAFRRAKDCGLGVTLHFGEVNPAAKEGELEELLSWQPDRIGHVIYVPGSAHSQPQGISFRPANATHIPLIYRAERDYMRDIEPSSLPGWANATDRNLQLWIDNLTTTTVLEVDEEVAGYVMWQEEHVGEGKGGEEGADGKGTALIISIHILPAFRRRGLGRQLLDVVTSQARAQGLAEVTLGVHRDNPAIALYSSTGFSKTGTDGDYVHYSCAISPKEETEGTNKKVKKDLQKVIADRKLGLELCLSCNVKLGMMSPGKGYTDHHFAEWKDTGCPIILCTDDVGIVGSEVSNEYRLVAEHFKMGDEEIKQLARCGIETIFGGEREKERLRNMMW